VDRPFQLEVERRIGQNARSNGPRDKFQMVLQQGLYPHWQT